MQSPRSIAWIARLELESRRRKNPQYSLRAFARSLGVPASTLSSLLSGRRNAGAHLEKQILHALQKGDRPLKPNLRPFQNLDLQAFSLVSDWEHDAFLELLNLKDYRPDIAWAAARLGIRVTQAKAVLHRLEQAGMLRVDKQGWHDTSAGYTTHLNPKSTSAAAKKYQRQLLERSLRSIDQIAYEHRSHTSATFPIHRERVTQAKELIQEFRRNLSRLLVADGDADDVYTLQISFFPSTRPQEKS